MSKDFTYTFLSPSDLRDFTGLSTSVIMQRQRIKVAVSWDLVRWHLRGMYGKIEEGLDREGVRTMRVRCAHCRCAPTVLTDEMECIDHVDGRYQTFESVRIVD